MRSNIRMRMSCAAMLLAAAGMTAWGQTAPATLPAGHPPLEPMGLPAGHPPMESLIRQPVPETMTGQAGAQAVMQTGTLNISVVAGTANGLSTANEPVSIALYVQGRQIKKMDFRTDGLGKVTVPNIPLMPPVDVVFSIEHGGLQQQAPAPMLTPEAPVQSVQMKVYEPTEERPAWTVNTQHVIVEYIEGGSMAQVTEVLLTSNPTDRAWIGVKSGEKRVTLTIPLPPGADHVHLARAFDEDDTRIVEGKLVTGSALFPGRSEFQYTYELPVKDGAVELPLTTAAPVENLMVVLPADGSQVTATGLTGSGEPMGMGQRSMRIYRAQNLAAGATAKLAIAGIRAEAAEASDAPAAASQAKNIALGGAFLLVLAGAALMLMKKPQARKA